MMLSEGRRVSRSATLDPDHTGLWLSHSLLGKAILCAPAALQP